MRRAVGVSVGLLLIASACRSSNVSPTQAASARVEQSVAEGFEASDKVESTTFRIRHNPAACDCPSFEVFAYGRWIRAFIDGSAAQADLENLRTSAPLAVAKVNGRVEQKPRAAENGVLYLVLTAR